MILEAAILNIKPGLELEFEAAMQDAKAIIASMKGFISLAVLPCLENDSRYLLEVRWDTLEDHTEGFRGSTEYQRWKTMLHRFYDPFPTVEHYGEPRIEA